MPTFSGTAGPDIYTGGIDNDLAQGFGGNDSLSGADGSDTLVGGAGSDTLDGGAGDDAIYAGAAPGPYSTYYPGVTTIEANLDTGSEPDTLIGGDGSDHLYAGYGDSVDGGANGSYGDFLYISFLGAPSGVTADFRQMTQTIGGGTITNVENLSYVQGSNFNDNLNVGDRSFGYSSFTTVHGMGGDDTITAGYYTGAIYGDAGNDVLDGGLSGYLNLVDGGDGNDTITMPTGESFAVAYGGAGDDVITANYGAHGGAGNDTITMTSSYYGSAPVSGDDGDDKITTADNGGTVAGGKGADTEIGGSGADNLSSTDFAATNSSLPMDDMGLEHDSLSGGGGNDALAIGYGDDADGGAGNDTLRLSFGGATQGVSFDTAPIVAGQPVTVGGGVIQNIESLLSLRGSEFADTLTAHTQSVQLTINGGAGDDVIISQGSSVTALGGEGNDRFVSGPAADSFDGGNGLDTVDYSGAAAGGAINLATGIGLGGDSLVSIEGVIGTSFDDTITASAASNVLDGGSGVNTLSYAGAALAGVNVALALQGTAQNTGGSGVDTISNFRNLVGSSFGDTLAGDAGDNQLDGGAGVDTISYAVGATAVNVSLALQGQAQNTGGAGVDTLNNFENLTGSAFNDTLIGNAGDNVIDGGGGTDLVSYQGASAGVLVSLAGQAMNTGSMGVDTLINVENVIGSAFNDTLIGGPGDNVIDGGGGVDTVSYSAATAGVTVSLAFPAQAQATGGAGVDTLMNIRNLTGSAFNDALSGDFQNNVLNGAAGSDTISGSGGDDTITDASGSNYLRGDDGNDSIQGGSGFDDINGNKGDDTIDGGAAGGDDWLVGGQGNDLITAHAGGNILYGNLGNDTLNGGSGAEILRGGQGDDVIVAGGGDDWISGDRGNDTMTGGAGADIFHTFSGAGMDRVTDFHVSEGDRVQLDPGTAYTVSQVGSDTVVDMGGGDEMVLVGVQMNTLPAGWIFGA